MPSSGEPRRVSQVTPPLEFSIETGSSCDQENLCTLPTVGTSQCGEWFSRFRNPMRLFSARLIIALIVGVTLVSLCSSGYEVLVGQRNMRRDLDRRSQVLAESLAGNVER